MQHVHHGSCGCGDDSRGRLDLYALNEDLSSAQVQCLNENKMDSGASIICCKWDDRLGDQFCSSSMDGELIFKINFGGIVQLKGIIIRSKYKCRYPKNVKIFVNPGTEVDFSNISNFKPAHSGIVDFDPKADRPILFRSPLFKSVTNLSIYVGEQGDPDIQTEEMAFVDEIDKQILEETKDEIVVNYIGLLGASTNAMLAPPKTKYELAPQPGDHPVQQINKQSFGFGL